MLRSSCIDIISECIDSNRIPSSLVSAQTICDIISTNDSIHCIDIKTFLDTKQISNDNLNTDLTELLVNACNPNPCSSNHICLVNNQCLSDQCLPFRCVTACRLGQYLISQWFCFFYFKLFVNFRRNVTLSGRVGNCCQTLRCKGQLLPTL